MTQNARHFIFTNFTKLVKNMKLLPRKKKVLMKQSFLGSRWRKKKPQTSARMEILL